MQIQLQIVVRGADTVADSFISLVPGFLLGILLTIRYAISNSLSKRKRERSVDDTAFRSRNEVALCR